MKFSFLLIISFVFTVNSFAQAPDKIITELEVLRVEKKLASDEMLGRRQGTPGIEKAALFIEEEFKKAGLGFLPGLKSHRQEFSTYRNKILSVSGKVGDENIDIKNVISICQEKSLVINTESDFEKVFIPADSNLLNVAKTYITAKRKFLVLVDTSHAQNFRRINRIERDQNSINPSVIFVLAKSNASTYDLQIEQEVSEIKLSNVVGVIEGSSKKDEMVIFSAHHDHLGTGKPNASGDSIYNGANDDAAGVTAVILLSKYFSQLKNNERTLIFSTFTAEESGGAGSRYFSRQLDAEKVVAMFNIEMIGTESKWGTKSAYITGFEKSDFGEILKKSVEGTGFEFYPDPYPEQKLFTRSDNARLAALGVPAHTISTSKMDAEPFYHNLDDEIETLDLQNMTEVIRAIVVSAKGIVSGKETPKRINNE
jgi:hypothetical protein